MTARLTPADRWHRFWYLQQVELWLEPMRGRDRRGVLRELRGNLDEAATEIGMDAALADLGSPRLLARRYLGADAATRPRWSLGALAAGLLLAAWVYATLFYALGMLDALGSTGTLAPARGSFLGTAVVAVFSGGEISASFASPPWAPLAVAVVVFLLVSRAWRLLRPRSAAVQPSGF